MSKTQTLMVYMIVFIAYYELPNCFIYFNNQSVKRDLAQRNELHKKVLDCKGLLGNNF